VHLPWILRSGELQPGHNKIGAFPDHDFLWATSNPRGDDTASIVRDDSYRSGKARHVRFVLDADDFIPWQQVPDRFLHWTEEHAHRLEEIAGKTAASEWWCRPTSLHLSGCARIETRSYVNNRWVVLPGGLEITEVTQSDGVWLSVRIGGAVFASQKTKGICGSSGYRFARVDEFR
jgi:hypothetical protein